MLVEFEVRSFNRFGTISMQGPNIWGSRDPGYAPFPKSLFFAVCATNYSTVDIFI